MKLLFIDGLPPTVHKGRIVRLLIEEGKLKKTHIGKIVLQGGSATIEISYKNVARLVRTLDGFQIATRHIRVWQQPDSSENPHFGQLLYWLMLEAKAEQKQATANQKSQSGQSLRRLVLRREDVGLGGRTIAVFAPRNEQATLPWTRFSVGSPILLTEEGGTSLQSWRGIVSRLNRHSIEVALTQSPEAETAVSTFRIDFASDEIARQRMQRAIGQISAARGNRTAVLRDILLGEQPAEFDNRNIPSTLSTFTAHLNSSQKEAIHHALAAEDIAVIHGPPGTGKTTAVSALILTAVSRQDHILACAPSNLAVDNIVERLAATGIRLVRLGHPARALPHIQQYSLDALVEQHDTYRQAKKLRKEAFALRRQASKFRRARPEEGEREALRAESKSMIDEARQMEAQAVEATLDQADVILSTLTAIDSATLGQRQFDLLIIDEAGQSTEPATWIPISRAKRVVLAGDHQQLPPTVISQKASREGFGISLLESVMGHNQNDGFPSVARRLDVQYRMNEQIMDFSSTQFYENSLQADGSVAKHLLSDLAGVMGNELTETAVTYIDTAGANYDEQQSAESSSYSNPKEAELVAKKVAQLQDACVPANAIAVITPYSGQVQLMQEMLPSQIEIGSVDGFQGREKEAVIISLVRSNTKSNVGFLAETRRMNVALTRARRKLIVIGDSATITAHPFYANLIDYFDTIGAYHSVWEEL